MWLQRHCCDPAAAHVLPPVSAGVNFLHRDDGSDPDAAVVGFHAFHCRPGVDPVSVVGGLHGAPTRDSIERMRSMMVASLSK